jgi:hypothetical protein
MPMMILYCCELVEPGYRKDIVAHITVLGLGERSEHLSSIYIHKQVDYNAINAN